MKGVWRWPLGDNATPMVARLQGWSCVLVGVASIVASVLQLLPHTTALFGAMIAMFFAGAGLFPWIWSVQLSRTKAPA
jgi:hypothetical protein